jgi:hypothetical protein
MRDAVEIWLTTLESPQGDFSSTFTVDGKTGYTRHLMKEAGEIGLTPQQLPEG